MDNMVGCFAHLTHGGRAHRSRVRSPYEYHGGHMASSECIGYEGLAVQGPLQGT